MASAFEIERLGPGDESRILAAAEVFDYPPSEAYTRRWVSELTNHLLVAYEGSEPAGFVSGIEVAHPDKPVEMLLYELGVRESSQRHGIGRALVEALRGLAVERGCAGMWVLTDEDNEAALRTYRASGARTPTRQVMFEWALEPRRMDSAEGPRAGA